MKKWTDHYAPTDRAKALLADRKSGMKLRELAEREGLSQERIRQVCRKTEWWMGRQEQS